MEDNKNVDGTLGKTNERNLVDGSTVKRLSMKKNRPSVFIGSATESHNVAQAIKEAFDSNIFEVDTWQMNIFGQKDAQGNPLKNAEQLKNFTDIYDFAIFVFSPDDKLISKTRNFKNTRKRLKADATRHNVVFEFGLFLGRIGAERSFILYHERVKDFVTYFFTDLAENLKDTVDHEYKGRFKIEAYPYKGKYKLENNRYKQDSYDPDSVKEWVKILQDKMLEQHQKVTLGFLPSTSLANGYFNNFLKIATDGVAKAKKPPTEKKPYENKGTKQAELSVEDIRRELTKKPDVKLKIVYPDLLKSTEYASIKKILDSPFFVKGSIPTDGVRPMTVYIKKESLSSESKEIVIYDIPSTMNSSIGAIDMTTAHQDIRELLSEKERRNFRKAIETLISDFKSSNKGNKVFDIVSLIDWVDFKKEIGLDTSDHL